MLCFVVNGPGSILLKTYCDGYAMKDTRAYENGTARSVSFMTLAR